MTEKLSLLPDDSEIRVSRRNIKRLAPGRAWPWEKKIEVVTKYLALGNVRMVSDLTGVGIDTIYDWKNADWWQEAVTEIKKTRSMKLDTKLSQLVDKSLEVIADRLENGEVVVNNKTGEIVRRPVSLRDSGRIANDLLAKQILLEEKANQAEVRETTMQETLALLAQEFSKWKNKDAKQNAVEVPFKDVEIINAVHEEREEGLQAGSGEVHFEARSEEEESTAERSTQRDGKEGAGA
jgi:hypothetical protein